MSYSELKDFEINIMIHNYIHRYSAPWTEGVFVADYCNNPSDAWPIILENKIGFHYRIDMLAWEIGAAQSMRLDENPLRGCMVAFLMINEGKA